MRRSVHRILTAAATLPLALGVVSVTTAGSAIAVTVHPDTCTHPTPQARDGSRGVTTVDNVPVRTGPWAACPLNGRPVDFAGTRFNYWCYVLNGNGFKWTYGTVALTQQAGWVLASNLSNGGSTIHC